MKRIIQFPHPKDEHGADRWFSASEGWKDWNRRNEHKRKFLWAEGSWTTNQTTAPRHGELMFWGEWEPQSRVRKLTQQTRNDPQWVHTPDLDLDVLTTTNRSRLSCTDNCLSDNGFQNTDPLV